VSDRERLSKLEREMAAAYAEVHSKRVRERLRRGAIGEALEEAQGVVAALERLYKDVKDEPGQPA
jgi:hypothetical protein